MTLGLRHILTTAVVFASQPATAATLSHTEVATVAPSAQIGSIAYAVLGQPVANGSDSAKERDSTILQFPGFDTQLGRLDSVVWRLDYSGGVATELLAACEVFKGLPLLGCRADASMTAEFLATARAVEFSAPGSFGFVPLLRPRSVARSEVTSTSNNIVCAIRGGINGPCADKDADSRVASNRVDRSAAREAYLRDFIAVTLDGELLADVDVTCTGISVAAVCGGSGEPNGGGTFEVTLEYGYTPARQPAPVPLGPTLPMAAAGVAALGGLRGWRAVRG